MVLTILCVDQCEISSTVTITQVQKGKLCGPLWSHRNSSSMNNVLGLQCLRICIMSFLSKKICLVLDCKLGSQFGFKSRDKLIEITKWLKQICWRPIVEYHVMKDNLWLRLGTPIFSFFNSTVIDRILFVRNPQSSVISKWPMQTIDAE